MNVESQHDEQSWAIGSHRFANPWILAPMAGVSERPYRVIALKHGAIAAPTELVSAKGLIFGQARTERYLARDEDVENPFWVQIFGGDPDSMAALQLTRLSGGPSISIWAVPSKVTRNGRLSVTTDPDRALMIEKMRRRVIAATKNSLGWDDDQVTAIDIGKVAQDAGASLVALHARTRAQGYSGHGLELISAIEALDIPVIGNGGAWNVNRAWANKPTAAG